MNVYFFLFQLAVFMLEVKVRTLHLRFSKLLLLSKKTVMVFQCMFVKLLSRRQKEFSLA